MMDIAVVTIAYNGYAKWLPQWARSIERMWPEPSQVAIALGADSGWERYSHEVAAILPGVSITHTNIDTMGSLRNVAVRSTCSEWVMFVSADDELKPDALSVIEPHTHDADFISTSWELDKRGATTIGKARTPEDIARGAKPFIVGHSPYRRDLFDRIGGYPSDDLPNQPFTTKAIEAGARFAKTERPATIHHWRQDSHAAVLGRGRTDRYDAALKREAIKQRDALKAACRSRYPRS